MDKQSKKLGKINGLIASLSDERFSGAVYSIAAVLPTIFLLMFLIVAATVGGLKGDYENADWYRYASFLIPQLAFAFIFALFCKSGKTKVKEVVGKPKLKYFIIAIVLQIGLMSLAELNTYFLKLLGKIGYEDDGIILPNMDGVGFIGVLFVIAVFPAIFEELIFRSLLLKGLKKFGECLAVIICGGLFALYHQNPSQTLYQFICGAAFALVAIRAGSVLPTVISHFINNAFILFATKFSWDLQSIYIPMLIVCGLCLVLSVGYLLFFDNRNKSVEKREKGSVKDFFIAASIGIFMCGFTWLSVLLKGK